MPAPTCPEAASKPRSTARLRSRSVHPDHWHTAKAALAFAGHWVSGGKWLLRELRELDPGLATRWLAARDDPAPIAAEVLARSGGPLFDGYRA
ncbi:hypothetical protein AB0M36_18495 [Actinoplanes sp. NPDC051346]|uniref:hypothetical protein n=1 Tax=Actinoplanes sp. NPDC051346 TaxID=3155048 RepID=UPI003444580C